MISMRSRSSDARWMEEVIKSWYGGCHEERKTYCFDMVGKDAAITENDPGILSK